MAPNQQSQNVAAQNVAAVAPQLKKKMAILIEGQLYDVSNFNHPGGSVIRFLATGEGEGHLDATNAFREFHCRSGKAEKYLKALPKIQGPIVQRYDSKEVTRRENLTRDLEALRKELVAEGRFDPSVVHIIYRTGELLAMFGLSFWLFSQHSQPWAVVLAVLVNGVAQGRCGWLQHEMGHNSFNTWIKLDHFLQEITYGVGCGMSAAWWRNQHNKHHAAPQQLKHDVDLDTLPLVAFNERIVEMVRPGSFLAKWLSVQAYVFAPVSCLLVGLFWSLFLHPRHSLRTGHLFELGMMAARYVGWFALLSGFLGYTLSQSALLYAASFGVGCTYIFLNFAVSHTHLAVSEADEYLHWLDYAAAHTTNVSTDSWFITWFMSYLNFQIEHHIFPSIPQYNIPAIAPRVRALFAKHGLHYDERPYLTAMRDTFANLHHVGAAAAHKDN